MDRRAAPWLGGLFLTLSLFRVLTLSRGTWADRLFLAVCLALGVSLVLLCLPRDNCQAALLLLPLGLGLFLRLLLLDHVTLDYQNFLSHWVEHFRLHGGFLALKDQVGNYNIPYLYLLSLLSYLPLPDLYGIKLFSILCDLLLAWGSFRLARVLSREDRVPLLAFSLLFLLPTVILNSSAWGQCDSLWACLCLHALSCGLTGRPKSSLALLALAFSCKLQAIFLIPLWAVLWFAGRVKLKHFILFPTVFLLSLVPALLLGKPWKELLAVYVNQAADSASRPAINYNSPSVFAFLPYRFQPPPWVPKMAVLLAFLLLAVLLVLLFLRRDRLTDTALVLAGSLMALGIPFLLPYMHERYFFLGVVLLIVLGAVSPAALTAGVCAELASLGGYHAYLLNRYALVVRLPGFTLTQPVEGLLMLLAVSWTLWALCKATERP